ncbi:MAG: ABC transporter substrate-binding protein [Culicoidibacterales bacterium]
MKNIKKILMLSLTAIFTVGLVACSTGSGSAGGKVALTFATWANEEEGKEIDAILEKLSKASKTYTLKQQIIPKDYYVKIQTQIGGNLAPDLFWLAQEYIPAYMETGTIAKLDSYLAGQTQIDMNDFYPEILATAQKGGSTYGLPWINQPYVVYYNKALISENDVKNWTWDDFLAVSNKVKTDTVHGYASTGNPPPEVFIWGEGGEVVTANGQLQLNTPEALAGLAVMNKVMSDKATMPFNEATSNGVENTFVNGKVGMIIGGATDDVEKKVKEAGANFEVGMAVMPRGSAKKVTFSWNASTVIAEQTPNKDVAFEALSELTQELFDYKAPAPIKSKADKVGQINKNKAYATDVITESLKIARGFNNQPKQNELASAMWDELTLPLLSNNDGKGNLDIIKLVDTTSRRWKEIAG